MVHAAVLRLLLLESGICFLLRAEFIVRSDWFFEMSLVDGWFFLSPPSTTDLFRDLSPIFWRRLVRNEVLAPCSQSRDAHLGLVDLFRLTLWNVLWNRLRFWVEVLWPVLFPRLFHGSSGQLKFKYSENMQVRRFKSKFTNQGVVKWLMGIKLKSVAQAG